MNEERGQPEQAFPAQRLVSLDVFRGLTIAGMFVVNTPGTWANVYPPLLHADWHGWTYTDTIFPFFLFIVGVSMAFSFGKRMARAAQRSAASQSRTKGEGRTALLLHTTRRAVIIFALGFGLNWLSVLLFHREQVRIPGVLQRIAVCFLFAALIYLAGGRKILLPAATALLVGYWALMTFVPVPGYGVGRLDAEGNLAAYVDRAILGAHTWKHDPAWDPEGLLSTLPAIATTLLGIAAGEVLRGHADWPRKLTSLIAGGAIPLSLGLFWSIWFPINKNLWTSSYSLFMAGLAAISLAVCIWVVDVRGWRGWSIPFQWLGTNAIALFVGATLATLLLLAIRMDGGDGTRRSAYATIYRTLFAHTEDPRLGSLLFALCFCGFWVLLGGLLYKRRIFIKV